MVDVNEIGSRGTSVLLADRISTPLGDMIAISSPDHLHLLEFIDRPTLTRELTRLKSFVNTGLEFSESNASEAKLSESKFSESKFCGLPFAIGTFSPTEQVRKELEMYFSGTLADFKTPIWLHGREFTQMVWQHLRDIPLGTTLSYAELANRMGKPKTVRAVARANATNQLAIVVPCHRVIGSDGALTGYGGGLWRKQRLLEIEAKYHPPDH